VRAGYDPSYGARPLKRAVQREIETPLARKLLSRDIRDGQTVLVDSKNGVLTFNGEPAGNPAEGGLVSGRLGLA